MLYLSYKPYEDVTRGPSPPGDVGAQPSSSAQNPPEQKRLWENVQEDAVDTYWRTKDGKIPRKRDTRFCKHGDKGMCDYCMPLEVRVLFYDTVHMV
jgi:nuclear protein localization protein 4 homolog